MGKMVCKITLDEIPQLINILKGEVPMPWFDGNNNQIAYIQSNNPLVVRCFFFKI